MQICALQRFCYLLCIVIWIMHFGRVCVTWYLATWSWSSEVSICEKVVYAHSLYIFHTHSCSRLSHSSPLEGVLENHWLLSPASADFDVFCWRCQQRSVCVFITIMEGSSVLEVTKGDCMNASFSFSGSMVAGWQELDVWSTIPWNPSREKQSMLFWVRRNLTTYSVEEHERACFGFLCTLPWTRAVRLSSHVLPTPRLASVHERCVWLLMLTELVDSEELSLTYADQVSTYLWEGSVT